MCALCIGGRLCALDGEHLFVERDGRGVRPDTEMIAERFAEPLESADRLPTLSGIEMCAHERPRRLLIGRVFFGHPIPQRCGTKHVEVATAQACARLDGPGLVEVVGEEIPSIQIGRSTTASLVGRIQPSLSGSLEALDVRLQSPIGLQHEHAAFVHDRLLVERTPGEVQGLSEVRAGGFGLALRPERLHDLRSVHPIAGGQREQLQHVCRATAPPRVARRSWRRRSRPRTDRGAGSPAYARRQS